MRLNGYSGKELFARVCYSDEIANNESKKGRNTVIISDEKAVLRSKDDIAEYTFTGSNGFCENDTVFINSSGSCSLLFKYSDKHQTVVVTNRCSSNCIMCPYTSDYRRRTTDLSDDLLLEQVRYLPSHTAHIVITGGEPTLKNNTFFQLVNDIKDRFPYMQYLLLTNGRSFSLKDICRKANDTFPKSLTAAIPIHASYAELHDRISQTTDSFEQSVSGIKNLIGMNIPIEIRIVVFKQNYQDMINIAEFIAETMPDVSVVNFMAAEMCGNAAVNRDDIWIDYNTAFSYCTQAIDILISNGINAGIYNFPLCSVPKKYWGIYRNSISDYKIRYGSICDECSEKNICGGVFASSLKYAEKDMKSIKENC